MANRLGRGWLSFLLIQVIILSAAAAATTHRLRQLNQSLELPPMRNQPLSVVPEYDRPAMVTDEQLQNVLHKLRPRLRGPKPKMNHVDHALRCWGPTAVFDDPDCLSGAEMLELILNDEKFKVVWGEDNPPLLQVKPEGVAVRTQEGLATASHFDHTLGTLAEIGIPLDYPIQTEDGQRSVQDLLEHSLRDFSLNQIEYEWSTLAYGLYLEPNSGWITSEGQQVTFDRLADRIMRQRLNQGVCMGNHRLHTLVMLLRLDTQAPIVRQETRKRIIAHLQDATARFIASQHSTGYWIRSWPDAVPPTEASSEVINTLPNRILATGHVLEWWSLAPEEVHPPREVMIRASQWLARTIEELDDEQVTEYYTFLTHAARALAMWRGGFPADLQTSNQQPTGNAELNHHRDPLSIAEPLSTRNKVTYSRQRWVTARWGV